MCVCVLSANLIDVELDGFSYFIDLLTFENNSCLINNMNTLTNNFTVFRIDLFEKW